MKIKAFTLVEIIIAMLISSILISIMASMYLSFCLNSRQMEKEQEIETDISLVYSALSSDMYKADNISLTDDNILKIDSVKYCFQKDCIIRYFLNNTDTLMLPFKEIKLIEKDDMDILVLSLRHRKDYKLEFTSRKKGW